MAVQISTRSKRLTSLLAGFLCSSGMGTLYLYSTYSTQLADRLGLTATETSIVGQTNPIGVCLFSFLAGYLVDTRGYLLPCLAGSVCLFVGYYTLYWAYSEVISVVPLLCFALLLTGFGSTLPYQACIKSSALNFPNVRATAVSIPMAGFGLSAFLFSTISREFFTGNTGSFLLAVTLMTSGLALFNTPFIHVYEDKEEEREGLPQTEQQPLLQENSQAESPQAQEGAGSETSSAMAQHAQKLAATAAPVGRDLKANVEQEVGGLALFKHTRYWMHFATLLLMSGNGQMYIYEVGYIVTSLTGGLPADQVQSLQALQVSIFSMTNFVGRLLSGLLSDYLKRQYGLQRLWVVLFALGITVVANIYMLSVPDETHLNYVSTMFGTAYGLFYGVFPTIISEAFGMAKFSQNWGLVSISQVIGSYTYSLMFGKIYDANSDSSSEGGKLFCYKGVGCFSTAFIIALVFNGYTVLHLLYAIHSTNKRRIRKGISSY